MYLYSHANEYLITVATSTVRSWSIQQKYTANTLHGNMARMFVCI